MTTKNMKPQVMFKYEQKQKSEPLVAKEIQSTFSSSNSTRSYISYQFLIFNLSGRNCLI